MSMPHECRCGVCGREMGGPSLRAIQVESVTTKMRIAYDPHYKTIWHEDCAVSPPGIMREAKLEDSRTLMECLACKRVAYYPVGGTGSICVEIVNQSPNGDTSK